MLSKRALAQFRAWGAQGGQTRAKRYTSKQISGMAKRASRERKRNGK